MAQIGYNVGTGFGGTLQNLSSTLITLVRLNVPASAGKRFMIWEIQAGQNSAPNATDCAVEYSLDQCSAAGAGTGTAATPYPTGSTGSDTAVTVATVNYTAEPTTYTQASEYYHESINQRGKTLWQAAPGGEIYIANTASQGPGLRAKSTNYTGTSIANIKFSEI